MTAGDDCSLQQWLVMLLMMTYLIKYINIIQRYDLELLRGPAQSNY